MRFVLWLVLLAIPAQAAPYVRFWRGWQLPKVTDFPKAIREHFVPATVGYGQEKGLIAYLPALPYQKGSLEKWRKQGVNVPDEIALVIYESQEKYQKLRSTPEGKAYGDLHWEYFIKEVSSSLTPEAFKDKVEVDHAYDILQNDENWQLEENDSREIISAIFIRNPALTAEKFAREFAEYLVHLKANPDVRGYLVSVHSNYWIEYSIWKSPGEFKKEVLGSHGLASNLSKGGEWSTSVLRFNGKMDQGDAVTAVIKR